MIYPAGITAQALASAVAGAQAMASALGLDDPSAAALDVIDPGSAAAFQSSWSTILAVLQANNAANNVDGAPLENNALDAQVSIGAGLQNIAAIGTAAAPQSSSAATIVGWVLAVGFVVGAFVLLGRAQSQDA